MTSGCGFHGYTTSTQLPQQHNQRFSSRSLPHSHFLICPSVPSLMSTPVHSYFTTTYTTEETYGTGVGNKDNVPTVDLRGIRRTISFFFSSNLSASKHDSSTCSDSKNWKRCGSAGRKSAKELEGGVCLRIEHDISFTPRLSSSTAVNVMDNVLGRGLLGVICCLYHELWGAETEREWEKLTEGGRKRKRRASPHYSPDPAKLGRFKLKV